MAFCFSKPNKKELLADSRERIADNERTLAVCKELAEDDTELDRKVALVYDAVRYMTPSASASVMQCDKKIFALAGDLKIALTKGRDRDIAHAESILRDIDVAIVERNSYCK